MNDRLTSQDISALFTLMAVAREIDNTELEQLTGTRITGPVRTRLNKLELVKTNTERKPYTHNLTKKGWVRCRYELAAATLPQRPGSFGYPFFAMLKALDQILTREGRLLDNMFQPMFGDAQDLATRIHIAYRKLAGQPGEWVQLTYLRPLLNESSKEEVDEALKGMSRNGEAILTPEPNRKALTADDRAAAIRIGGEDNHLIAIEES